VSSTTPRLGFFMPEDDGSDPVNVATDINDNLEKLDSAVGFVPATSGSPPVAPYNGMGSYETDTGRAKFWQSASSTWNYILTTGAQFLNHITIATNARFGIGMTSPTALVDIIVAVLGSVPVMKVKQTSEATHRFQMDHDGLRWGGGTVATDTRFYRSATANMALTGNLTLENNLTVTGSSSLAATAITGTLSVDGTVTSDIVIDGDFSVTGTGFSKYIRKTTDTARLATVTVANDPEMFVSLEANTIYYVEMFLAYRGSTSGDFRSCWGIPTGATGFRWCLGEAIAGTDRESTSMRTGGHNLTSELVYGGHTSGVITCGWETLYVVTTTAGTLNFKWAQGSSDGTNSTSLAAGTFMRVTKVA
jgi:hypothetical protein